MVFNKHFCSVFKRDNLQFSDFSEKTLNKFEFTIQDVDKALRQTKPGSSTVAINGDFILSQVWSPNRKDLSKLEQFQKNVSKWICKGATYKTRLISSGLFSINLLKINDLLFLNRILDGMYDFDFHNFLSITYPCDSFYYNTRSTLKPVLKVKSTRTKQADNHFFQRIVPLSNSLMKEHNVYSFVEPNIFKPRVKQLFKRLFASDEYVL